MKNLNSPLKNKYNFAVKISTLQLLIGLSRKKSVVKLKLFHLETKQGMLATTDEKLFTILCCFKKSESRVILLSMTLFESFHFFKTMTRRPQKEKCPH